LILDPYARELHTSSRTEKQKPITAQPSRAEHAS
jgi:hypothetical protein